MKGRDFITLLGGAAHPSSRAANPPELSPDAEAARGGRSEVRRAGWLFSRTRHWPPAPLHASWGSPARNAGLSLPAHAGAHGC